MNSPRALLTLALAVLLSACGPGHWTYAVGTPRPNLPIAARPGAAPMTLRVAFAPTVQDSQDVPAPNGNGTMTFVGITTAVRDGVNNGFGEVFHVLPATATEPADLTIRFDRIDLRLATLGTTTVASGVSLNTYASQVGAQITFRAAYIDRGGNVAAVIADTVEGRRPMTSTNDIPPVTADALEVMLEDVWRGLAQAARASAPAAPSSGGEGGLGTPAPH